jgi:lipopolysaccharide heptosyltransferase I
MDAPSILIVLMGSLGDVVRGLALVRELRRAYPRGKITWLVEPRCEGVVRLHPDIDRVICFRREKGLRGVAALRRELRRDHFDIALDLQRHFKSGFFSWLSRAKRRIGFHRRDTHEGNWIFNNEHIEAHGEGHSKLGHYLLFLKALGIPAPLPEKIDFGLKGAGEAPPELAAVEHGVGLVLGTSWESKEWPYQGYADLLRALIARRMTPVLIGTGDHALRAGRLAAECGPDKVVNLAGKTDLRALLGALRRVRVCVGPDSGPAHLAGAVGTPHITLFGPTDPRRVAPYGSEHLSLQSAVGCAPCMRRRCPGLGTVCMRLVSVTAVLEKLDEVFAGMRAGHGAPPR